MSKDKGKKSNRKAFWLLLPFAALLAGRKSRKPVPVYFISGMCYNCKVFDRLKLPNGYVKHYLEWRIPRPDETLQEYACTMAGKIDTSRPFVVVGYSFGAVVMQEMCEHITPLKSIVISSFKHPDEVPPLFQMVKKFQLAERMPMRFYSSTETITGAFNRLVYQASNAELEEFMTYTDPVYIRWAIVQITNWVPHHRTRPVYHIHGTNDQIFPFERLKNVFPVEHGDHLMVFKKASAVNAILNGILLMDESG